MGLGWSSPAPPPTAVATDLPSEDSMAVDRADTADVPAAEVAAPAAEVAGPAAEVTVPAAEVTVRAAVAPAAPAESPDKRRTQLTESVCDAIVLASRDAVANYIAAQKAAEEARVAAEAKAVSAKALSAEKEHVVREPWFSLLESGRKTVDIRRAASPLSEIGVDHGHELVFVEPKSGRRMRFRVTRTLKYAGPEALPLCFMAEGVERIFPGLSAAQAMEMLRGAGWKLDQAQRNGIDCIEFERVT